MRKRMDSYPPLLGTERYAKCPIAGKGGTPFRNLCRSARTEIPPQQEGPACNTPSDISAGQRHAGECSRLALYGYGIAESDIALDREEVRLESRTFVFLYMNIYAHLSGT